MALIGILRTRFQAYGYFTPDALPAQSVMIAIEILHAYERMFSAHTAIVVEAPAAFVAPSAGAPVSPSSGLPSALFASKATRPVASADADATCLAHVAPLDSGSNAPKCQYVYTQKDSQIGRVSKTQNTCKKVDENDDDDLSTIIWIPASPSHPRLS